ncbi:MAG TPA: methylmalonyl-CoA mutase family protein [Saprospiraceae bacterium]|nr:methylmalonyl-CoA mutase family protein [Saprospiraceae bacterium]
MSVSFEEFNTQTREEWIAKANQDLKGKKDANEFIYFVEEGLQISPFQTNDSAPTTYTIEGPKTISGVIIGDTNEANQVARKFLENGAQALAFDVISGTNYENLFEGIHLDMITTHLMSSNNDLDQNKLSEYISKSYSDKNVDIIIDGNHTSGSFKKIVTSLDYTTSFRLRIQQITKTFRNLADGNEYQNTVIKLSLKKDFLAQIAELRAIRVIWSKVLEEKKIIFTPLTIISTIDILDELNDDIHPLIQANYLLMSAYMGMSDIAFGLPCSSDSEMARLSLNIQHIFKEESLLDQVVDPTRGSYIIESLTDQMVKIGLESCQ